MFATGAMLPMDPESVEVWQLLRRSPYAWGGLIAVMATLYIVGRAGTWLSMAVSSWPLHRYRGDLWSERARRTWPSRRIGTLAVLLLGLPACLSFSGASEGFTILPRPLLMIAASVVVTLGVLQSTLRRERRLNPAFALTPSADRSVWISRLLVYVPLSLIIIVMCFVLPDRLNGTAIAILIAMALGVGLYLAKGWTILMRRLGVIRPACERLRLVVERAAEQVGFQPRGVDQVALPIANAFAFVLEGRLGVSDAALAILDDDKLAAVCVHELAHLKEPRRIAWARASRGLLTGVYVALIAASVRPLPGSYGLLGLLGGILTATVILFVGLSLSNRLSRRMEHQADAQATESQSSAGVYAQALERIYEINLVPAVLSSKRTTHPDLYDRMLDAGLTPDYPRPAPPPRWASLIGLLTLLFALVAGNYACRLVARSLPDALFDGRSSALWKFGAGHGEIVDLHEILEVNQADREDHGSRTSPSLRHVDSSRGTVPGGGSRSQSG
jgi:Zn-dependent protease with chaperone function